MVRIGDLGIETARRIAARLVFIHEDISQMSDRVSTFTGTETVAELSELDATALTENLDNMVSRANALLDDIMALRAITNDAIDLFDGEDQGEDYTPVVTFAGTQWTVLAVHED